MNTDTLARIEGKLDGLVADVAVLKADVAELKTDVAVLKTDVAVLKTDVAVLKSDVASLTCRVVGLEDGSRSMRGEMTAMAADIHKLAVLQETARADAQLPFERVDQWRAHMDRQFERTRREMRETVAPLELAIRDHSRQFAEWNARSESRG